jgi:vacuolar-type H+-ATPase subunit I/STV1
VGIEDIELDVGGGVKFKGVYIAILMSFATTIGGGIWAASEFVSRIGNLETSFNEAISVIEKIEPLEVQVANINQRMEDNDIATLQGKLSELSTLLESIKSRQQEVLTEANVSAEKVEEMRVQWVTVLAEYKTMSESLQSYQEQLEKFKQEIDNLWEGMDNLASPL